ncbi:cell wall metabolism sensor histidine kinase WalK [Blastococcus sp. TF02A-26]|uniref:sensor histidine kinase n=1 Tax=Blastococcus sp. TF02A-26 TaxID=2250577 RepID=UPI000DEBAC8E|nr:ATP-binding protein [Blastococcus sp. TF02A-26]RBY82344.1 two-component sensor histidine kinase [Blastococcus sp. TF02A-26]
MSPTVALVTGLVLGAVLVGAVVVTRRRLAEEPVRVQPDPTLEQLLSRRLLDLMDPAVVVVDLDEAVLLANPAARALGIVRGTRLLVPELLQVVRDVRDGGSRRADVSLPGDLVGSGPRRVGVHGVRLESGSAPVPGPVALVLQDVTEARRVEEVRRDFVANVGHELKTPVGALALLAEAVQDAADDPETVQRFATRMSHEADRLARLVRELVDLSRLQGGEPLPELVPVDVDTVLHESTDRTGLAAAAKKIDLVVGGERGLVVRGVEAQLATAVTNLLANAVHYSPENTRIAVAARARSGFAEIAVTDSGIGIPREDRARVFERFYRVDQSRASSTGGTGLGLAIVKHVASNHGGSVSVWSEEGLGSTFTLRIPLAAADAPDTAGQTPTDTGSEPAAAQESPSAVSHAGGHTEGRP